jgi:hypothetical protein
MKKTKKLKSIIGLPLIIFIIISLILGGLWLDNYLSESRAQSFCNEAMKKNSVVDIKQLSNTAKGMGNFIATEQAILATFPQKLPQYHTCIIRLDESGKPKNSEIIFKD